MGHESQQKEEHVQRSWGRSELGVFDIPTTRRLMYLHRTCQEETSGQWGCRGDQGADGPSLELIEDLGL